MRSRKKNRNQRGSILLLGLMILAIGSMVISSAMNASTNAKKISGNATYAEISRYATEDSLKLGALTTQEVVAAAGTINDLLNTSSTSTLNRQDCTLSWLDNLDDEDPSIDGDNTFYIIAECFDPGHSSRAKLKALVNVTPDGGGGTPRVAIYSISDA